jgi:hypothetical protein
MFILELRSLNSKNMYSLSGIYRNPFKQPGILLLFGSLVFVLDSCGRCEGCRQSEGIAFYNFSRADMDSVFIKEYTAGSNFTNVTDSQHVSLALNTDSSPYYLLISIPFNGDTTLKDILIYLPADSLTYKINHISVTQAHCSRCPEIQLFNLNSYYVNGVKDTGYAQQAYGYGGYLKISK